MTKETKDDRAVQLHPMSNITDRTAVTVPEAGPVSAVSVLNNIFCIFKQDQHGARAERVLPHPMSNSTNSSAVAVPEVYPVSAMLVLSNIFCICKEDQHRSKR